MQFGVNGIVTTNLTKIKNDDVQANLSDKDFKQFLIDGTLERGGMSGELVREKANAVLVIVANRIKKQSST